MGRSPCCDKANVKRGPWSPGEDATLKSYLENHGTGGNWIALPQKADAGVLYDFHNSISKKIEIISSKETGLKRCGKSCRLRWLNYLRPDIKHGGFTEEEDSIICTLYSQMGSRWSLIASHLPGRTDNDVKNYWNTKLKKKILTGKISLTIKNSSINATTNISNPTTTPDSKFPILCDPKAETESTLTLSDYSLTQSSVALPSLSDIGYGPIIHSTQSLSTVDQFQFPLPGVMDMSEFGPTSVNNQIVSPSQEGSSISDSSPFAMDHKRRLSLPDNGGLEDASGILMDSEFGLPSEFVNSLLFQDKASEVSTANYYQHLVDFGYVDVKPQGLNPGVTNQY